MKKKLPTHDDTPSKPLEPKIIESEAPNYEGDVRGTKYEIDEDRPIAQPLTAPTSKSGDPYPLPDDDIDIYSVDTRIWDRIAGMGGDGGGPHTHDGLYAPVSHEHDGDYLTELPTHDHPHNHDGDYTSKDYVDDQDRAWDAVAQGYTDDALADHLANTPHGGGDGESYDDTEVRNLIQGNTDALAGKSDTDHTHPEYEGGSGESYDDTEVRGLIQANTDALANKADDPHEHPIQPHYHDYDGNLVDGGDFVPHNHNGVYQPVGDYADATHTHDTTHDHDGTYQPAGDYATKTELSTGLAGKSDTTHTHPEYEGGGSGGGSGLYYPYDKAVLFGANTSLYLADSNFFDKTLFPNGTLKYFYRVGQTASTTSAIYVQSEWSYAEKSSSAKVVNIHAEGAVVAETGIIAPMVSYGIYGKTINFHPSCFVEATEAGKDKLLEVILASMNGGRGYVCGGNQSDGTAMAAKSITTPTRVYDGMKHKNFPVWLALDQLKQIWVVGDKDALVEGQELTGLRMMTAEEFASFQLEEQSE